MDYICNRETFLKAREAQIEMMNERRSGSAEKAYEKAHNEWILSRPKEEPGHLATICKECGARHYTPNPAYSEYMQKYNAWRAACPPNPGYKFSAHAARHLNIFYAILKGRSYSQIEPKVRRDNEFSIFNLRDLCKEYGVDFEAFKARLP